MKSIPCAVVTNGSAGIVFPAVRTEGITFEDTQARIFRNLEDIKIRIVEFWELLSRQRVTEGNLMPISKVHITLRVGQEHRPPVLDEISGAHHGDG
jgi:hypothetical protein